jgi:hypothetical protein
MPQTLNPQNMSFEPRTPALNPNPKTLKSEL